MKKPIITDDLNTAANAAANPVDAVDVSAEAPLPAVPADVQLTEAEKVVLGRVMEYTRKGKMKPRMVTRQQWIEDFLTRGFNKIERLQFGRSPVRLRISAPDRVDRRGRSQFYEVQSAIEIGYVERRHAAIHGNRTEAAAEPPPAIAPVAAPVATPQPEVSTEAAEIAAGMGVEWVEEVTGLVASEAQAVGEGASAGVSEREAAFAETVLSRLPSEESAASVAEARQQAQRLARVFFRAMDERNLGRLFAVLERSDAAGDAAWAIFQRDALRLGEDAGIERTAAKIRAEVRRWATDDEWTAFLESRAERRRTMRDEARDESAAAREARYAPERADFYYGRERGELAPRGTKARIRANIAAIRLLKQLEQEDRDATPEEKEVLAQFNGWGEHKALFEDGWDSEIARFKDYYGEKWFEEVKSRAKRADDLYGRSASYGTAEQKFMSWWSEHGALAQELKELLTKDEWNSAAQSILNAFYTSEEMSHFLWDAVAKAGFVGGKVIDPAVGASGRILAAMPPELRAKSRVEAVDIDSISARMAKKLFPQAKVHECGFEEALIAPGSADLVITNVPFSEHGPGVQSGLGPVRFNLHNYFVAETMRKLKPGGLAFLITSASTLENNDEQRRELAKMGELWGAVRLPSDAFKTSAGTDVVTDMLVLRKPDGTMQSRAEDWSGVQPVSLPPEGVFTTARGEKRDTVLINEYFVRHPEMVLGYHSLNGRMYGRDESNGQYTVTSPRSAEPLAKRLAGVLEQMPGNIPNSSQRTRAVRDASLNYSVDAVAEEAEKLMATMSELPGNIVLRDGRVFEVQPSRELALPEWMRKNAPPTGFSKVDDALRMATDFIKLREKLEAQISLDLNRITTDAASAKHRRELKAAYDDFTKRHGTLADNTKRLRSLAPRDSTVGTVLALEMVREDKENRKRRIVTPMPILSERTLFPPEQKLKADTLEEAALASLSQSGGIDAAFIADLLGKDDVEAISEQLATSGLAFRVPDAPEQMEARVNYLSGDVLTKLDKARKAAEADPRFAANVAALEAVAPAPVPWENIRAAFGATWLPSNIIIDFLRETTGAAFSENERIFYNARGQSWVAPTLDNKYSASADARYGTKRVRWTDVVQHALNQTQIEVRDTIKHPGGSTTVVNVEATAEANARVEALRADWDSWTRNNVAAQAELTKRYNEIFNRVVVAEHDGSHLSFPGLAKGPGALVPRFYQRNSVARFLPKPAGVIAHAAGYGKTLTSILLVHESRRIGSAKKPLMVCDSANYEQFVQAYRKAYPQDRILVADDANFTPAERENFKAMVAYGDWDCVLMSRTQFEKIPISAETEERWLGAEIDELRGSFDILKESGDRVSARRTQKAIENKTQRLKAVMEEKSQKADRGLTWEQMGIDLLVVDECHRHKKCGFATAHERIKGIDPTVSNRGRDLLIKGRFIQDRRNGVGVVGLSGTPATNTMAEFWNMVRLFDPNTLDDFNVQYFDEFKSAFCVTQNALEMNEANGKYRYVTRLAKFINGPALISFVRQGCDVQMDPTKLGLKLPKHETGDIEFCIVPITDTTLAKMDDLADLYQRYESSGDKKELSWVPIMLMQMGMAASIDPRLIDPKAADEPDSLVNVLAGNVARLYKETAAERKTQVVFLDRYREMNTSVLHRLKGAKKMSEVKIEIDDSAEPVAVEADDDNAEGKTAKEAEAPRGSFDLYEELRSKLIAQGVKPEEVAVISDAKTPRARAELFERVNRGEVRVILGSSDKLGIGANFQERLYAAHHFDPPRNMTPDQMEQRDARIVRSGNTNEAVRVIYYGVQDTVTPAIYNRIQTKRKFIKQGLASSARDVEFEDVSEVRLEELKAALVTDKRQLKLAELLGEIKDEQMQISITESRIATLRNRVEQMEFSIRHLGEKELPRAEREAAFISQHTRPFDGKLRVDVSGLSECKTPEVREWLAKQESPIIEGDAEAVEKTLRGLVDGIKKTEMPPGKLEVQLGKIEVNGLALRLSFNEVTFRTSGRDALAALVRVVNPLNSEEPWSEPTNFGSPEMLVRTAAYAARAVSERPTGLRMKLDQVKRDLEAVQKEAATVEAPSHTRLAQLKENVREVQADMAKNPYVRGADRKKQREGSLAASAQNSMDAATQAPVVADNPKKAAR